MELYEKMKQLEKSLILYLENLPSVLLFYKNYSIIKNTSVCIQSIRVHGIALVTNIIAN